MYKRLLFLFVLLPFTTSAQQLLEISPISNQTILFKFDEGEKDFSEYNGFFFYEAPNATYYGEINETQALIPSNFTIQSVDDSNYISPLQAVSTFFKSKEQVL